MKKFDYYFGIHKKFQGFGVMLSFDNAITERDFICFQVRFLWLNCWIIIYKKTK